MIKYTVLPFRVIILTTVCLLFLYSCMNDRYDFNKISDEIQLRPRVTIPVAFGSFTLEDIFYEFGNGNNSIFQIKLPSWVTSIDVSLNDTANFDFEKELGDLIKFINYLRITLDADNGMPLKTYLQVYFAGENYKVIDSMFIEKNTFLEPAQVGEEGIVSVKSSLTHKIEFTGDKIDKLKSVKYALISAIINITFTEQNRDIKLYSNYALDYRLKLKADLTINSRNL